MTNMNARQHSNTVVVVVEDNTVVEAYSDLDLRVIVVEPGLIPEPDLDQVSEATVYRLQHLDFDTGLKRKVMRALRDHTQRT